MNSVIFWICILLRVGIGDPWNPYPIRGELNFNVKDFGAKGDNITIDSAAFQYAIDSASHALSSESQSNIAYVTIPKGSYLIASINLTSNVYLVLEKEAVLQGSSNPLDYAYDWDQWNVVQANFSANTGIISPKKNSQGGEIRGSMWQMIAGWNQQEVHFIPKNWVGVNGCNADCRPFNLAFFDSINITIANIRISDSAFWTQLFRRCQNVNEFNVIVFGATQYPNNDGIDIESCENVTITDSEFRTGDDCIAIRSGHCQPLHHPWKGRMQPSRNIRLKNLTLTSTSSAIKIDSVYQKKHGDVYDIDVRDVTIKKSNRGIGIWERTGNGSIAGIIFENIQIETELKTQPNFWGSGEPIVITSIPTDSLSQKFTDQNLKGIRNITFSNITARSEGGIMFSTFSTLGSIKGRGMIADIIVKNLSMVITKIGNATQIGGFHDFSPAPDPMKVPAKVDGLFIDGHCQNIQLENLKIEFRGRNKNWTRQCIHITERSPFPLMKNTTCHSNTTFTDFE